MIESLEGDIHLRHGQKVVLLGSCFSDNFAPKFERSGFVTLSNPLGTIFHPLALSEILRNCLDENPQKRSFNRDDVWLDWRASGTIYSMTQEGIHSRINQAFAELKDALLNAHLLVVTFGTAWGYFLESGEIAANCHKMPKDLFDKRMSSLDELYTGWTTTLDLLKEKNPELKVVFTVSPVEHVKDGIVGNSRSKARLIELTSKLENNGAHYFYSYEWVKSHLSEKQNYKSDGLHLNDQGIEFLWQTALLYFLDTKSIALAEQVTQINTMREHRSIHPESREAHKFQQNLEKQIAALREKHPEIYWKD